MPTTTRVAAKELEQSLSKAKAVQVDASKVENIVAAAEGCDLIVNGLPPDFNMRVMDAALEVGANYLDMASCADENDDWINGVRLTLAKGEAFEKAGLTALIDCGSAPGIANVVTREACDLFDSVETIDINVYEGIWTNRFIPFLVVARIRPSRTWPTNRSSTKTANSRPCRHSTAPSGLTSADSASA